MYFANDFRLRSQYTSDRRRKDILYVLRPCRHTPVHHHVPERGGASQRVHNIRPETAEKVSKITQPGSLANSRNSRDYAFVNSRFIFGGAYVCAL